MVKDLFSVHTEEYSRYRPKYPIEIYEFLNSVVLKHERAWDCATGNGQAAMGLVPYFDEVLASDISEEQLEKAEQNPKIIYFKAQAENCELESTSIDLIVAATAIHLLDLSTFSKEANRILRPGGTIAAWNYTRSFITPEIDRIVESLFMGTLEGYWDKDILAFFREEKNIELPFKSIAVPDIIMQHNWTFNEFVNYIFTWSASQAYLKKNNTNPAELIYDELLKAWGGNNIVRSIRWKFYFKAWRK